MKYFALLALLGASTDAHKLHHKHHHRNNYELLQTGSESKWLEFKESDQEYS